MVSEHHYAGDGRPYTGPSYRAMVILAILAGLTIGILLGLADYASAQGRTAWQVWMECVGRYHGGQLPNYCIEAYRAVTGR